MSAIRIFHVSWYDEDEYGPTRTTYAIVQAVDQFEAVKKAKVCIMNRWNVPEEQLSTYEKHDVTDLTSKDIIATGYDNFA